MKHIIGFAVLFSYFLALLSFIQFQFVQLIVVVFATLICPSFVFLFLEHLV